MDNHTILNVGRAVAESGTLEYYELVRSVRSAAFAAIMKLPPALPIIFTNVVARGGTSGFLEENWQAIIDLAKARGCPLFSVTLTCSPVANAHRIVSEERGTLGKIQKPKLWEALVAERVLFDDGATYRITIDNTHLSPVETARRIHDWINSIE
ncbi:hypothetical protein GGE16_000723 [Rhizobium leguminosarum]|uniref:Shikimate kinase n=1 Tax=Rhizobium leguminosarum TaxID=384 RepID=A0AAE2MGC2_RHILE|nr:MULTISPECIES: hypothetical protein [Rhizobium]MBB4288707.1 hypothetical protein [Rhizobium leguminosarum]MBB4295200.1 hypothetical protein [Rhizobium leguminosarum]MBB4306593.1 hypothetical protein [Rhizobium leguminosarum]MBB4417826.1 hypothetical protein [Rhizobium leguminosarum]MBB4432671.1 hypothetical protein [Rhizobium esperanzae]